MILLVISATNIQVVSGFHRSHCHWSFLMRLWGALLGWVSLRQSCFDVSCSSSSHDGLHSRTASRQIISTCCTLPMANIGLWALQPYIHELLLHSGRLYCHFNVQCLSPSLVSQGQFPQPKYAGCHSPFCSVRGMLPQNVSFNPNPFLNSICGTVHLFLTGIHCFLHLFLAIFHLGRYLFSAAFYLFLVLICSCLDSIFSWLARMVASAYLNILDISLSS
jgi:hypothetical protein